MALQDTIAAAPIADALQRVQAGKSYWARVRGRLLADPITVAVTTLLLIIVVMVAAAPLIATYDPSVGSAFAERSAFPIAAIRPRASSSREILIGIRFSEPGEFAGFTLAGFLPR